jgi:hypothetical protein
METDSNNITIYNIECSPSYIINNLSMSKNSLYFIHNSQSFPRILIVNKKILKEKCQNKSLSVLNSSEKNEMLFIKSIFLKDTEYIAVGLYNGFKLWNKEGNRLLYQISNPNSNKYKIYAFVSCSPFLINPENQTKDIADCVIAGDNYGQLHLIYGAKSSWKSSKLFTTPNAESILSIGSSLETNKIGLTLDNGDILILKIEKNSCNLEKKIEGDGKQNIAINSVVFSNNGKNEFFLACGFINGMIKIISLNDYNLKFCINSNLRSVGPMIVKGNDEIVTGSDDGQIIVWKYDDTKDKIVLKKNLLFEDKMIVGLAYDNDDNNLYITCYDFPEIIAVSDV